MGTTIYGTPVGCGTTLGKTVELVSDDGSSLIGVVVDQEQIMTAVASQDIREGKTAVTSEGLVTGSKRIPAYETTTGSRLVSPNASYSIPLSDYDKYNYTKFTCVIAERNTSTTNSVSVNKISIGDNVYEVNSLTPLSSVTKNTEKKSIDLNLINNTDKYYYIHYFTYKEEEL